MDYSSAECGRSCPRGKGDKCRQREEDFLSVHLFHLEEKENSSGNFVAGACKEEASKASEPDAQRPSFGSDAEKLLV